MKKITFKEVIASNNSNPVEFSIVAKNGLKLTASCWTDDESIIDTPAVFALDADWQINHFNQVDDVDLMIILDKITEKFGGDWTFDAADETFYQV